MSQNPAAQSTSLASISARTHFMSLVWIDAAYCVKSGRVAMSNDGWQDAALLDRHGMSVRIFGHDA